MNIIMWMVHNYPLFSLTRHIDLKCNRAYIVIMWADCWQL